MRKYLKMCVTGKDTACVTRRRVMGTHGDIALPAFANDSSHRLVWLTSAEADNEAGVVQGLSA